MRLLPIVFMTLFMIGCGNKSKSDQERIAERNPQTTAPVAPETIAPDTATRIQEGAPPQPPTEAKETPKPTPSDVNPLINKRWKLVELLGEPVVVTEGFAGDPYVTFALRNRKMTGSGGCNRFGCKYSLDGERIKLSGFAATKKLCKDAMLVEEPFLRELALISTYKVDGDTMWLLKDGKRIMKFAALYL